MTRQRQAMAQAYAHLLNSHMQLQPHVRVPPHTIVAGVELALIDLGEVSLGLQGHKRTVRGFKLGGSSGSRSLRLHPQNPASCPNPHRRVHAPKHGAVVLLRNVQREFP